MRLVVGLGNPGARYDGTRHNAGFMVVDRLAGQRSFLPAFAGLMTRVDVEEEETVLLKPQTYMNRSGEAVAAAAGDFDLPLESIVVIHDEVDLDFGVVRVKHGGGAGGHRGLKSIFAELGSQDFDRVRVGIGRPTSPEITVTDYVLDEFDVVQAGGLDEVLDVAARAVETTVTEGAAAAMNEFNRRRSNGGEE